MGKIIMIVARDSMNGIGKSNGIPWHYPEDMRHFHRTTRGHNVVMGRKTWESIGGKALPDRTNIILSESHIPGYDNGVFFYQSEKGIFEIIEDVEEDFYIIGGQQIYEQFLPHADEIITTEIPGNYECDTFFPKFTSEDWILTDVYYTHIPPLKYKYYKRR